MSAIGFVFFTTTLKSLKIEFCRQALVEEWRKKNIFNLLVTWKTAKNLKPLKLGNKIDKIFSIDADHFKIKLRFRDGVSGEVDLSFIFFPPQGLATEIMKGQLFSKCFIASRALVWPNGLGLCADSLKMRITTKKNNVTA